MKEMPGSILRSFLFCPATNARRLAKTLAVETDAVIVDLKDALAASEKRASRAPSAEILGRQRDKRKIYVRGNALTTPWSFADFQAVVVRGLDGIVLPKVESATDIHIADYLIGGWEAERGLPRGSIDLMPIIETAKGVEAMGETLRASMRVRRACFGAGDFTNDTDTVWSRDNPLCAHARASLAIASRAADREPPIDTVWAELDDEAGFLAETEEARRLEIVHPPQAASHGASHLLADATPDRGRAQDLRRLRDRGARRCSSHRGRRHLRRLSGRAQGLPCGGHRRPAGKMGQARRRPLARMEFVHSHRRPEPT
jgi:citrate lyase subunit beta/citryl-CoA lyase